MEVISVVTVDRVKNGVPFIQVEITNSGSQIPADDLPNLFEAFFTKGKKGGTGLGLAIAKKVVTSHGGEIECRSGKDKHFPGGFVTFVFTLPARVELDVRSDVDLPVGVLDVARLLEVRGANLSEADTGVSENLSLDLSETGQVQVVVVDDETVYRESVLSKISGMSGLLARSGCFVSSSSYESGEAFLSSHIVGSHIDLLILDIDMGKGIDGFELLARVKEKFSTGLVCVHSNRITAPDQKRALDLGADAFIPKPLSTEHLGKLLVMATKSRSSGRGCKQTVAFPVAPERRLKIAVVDDALSVRLIWKARANYAEVSCFKSPEEFFRLGEGNCCVPH